MPRCNACEGLPSARMGLRPPVSRSRNGRRPHRRGLRPCRVRNGPLPHRAGLGLVRPAPVDRNLRRDGAAGNSDFTAVPCPAWHAADSQHTPLSPQPAAPARTRLAGTRPGGSRRPAAPVTALIRRERCLGKPAEDPGPNHQSSRGSARPHASIRLGDVWAAGPETVNPLRSGRPNPAAPFSDRDLVTELIARQELEGPVQGQLSGMMRRCLPSNQDVTLNLVDRQVPDAAVSRLMDPRLDLLGEGLHRRAPVQRRHDDPGVLRPGRYGNPFHDRTPFLSCAERHVKQSPTAYLLFWQPPGKFEVARRAQPVQRVVGGGDCSMMAGGIRATET